VNRGKLVHGNLIQHDLGSGGASLALNLYRGDWLLIFGIRETGCEDERTTEQSGFHEKDWGRIDLETGLDERRWQGATEA
jgi:hypothetical protein